MKFKEVPPNKEFYWNPRKDEISGILVRATKVPEFPTVHYTTVSHPEFCDWERVNAIGHDTDTGHFSFYTIEDDDEVELVDTPIKFKDIDVGVYFYRWPEKGHLYMKTEEVLKVNTDGRPVAYNVLNAVIVDLNHHSNRKMLHFSPDNNIQLWDNQVW